ncbi:MAG: methyltransferase domain-containing protein [Pseudomonadota bacterium]
MTKPPPDSTIDDFYGGAVKLVQAKKGFRAGTDSVLLSAALDVSMKGHALEVGCGAGGALLPAAWRLSNAQFCGLERDPDMVARASYGAALNEMGGRVEIVQGDAAAMPKAWENLFDLVFSNPPFFAEGTIKQPGPGKDGAYLESLPLKDWLNAMLFALRPKGTLVMIHRASELAKILSVIERQTGEIAVLPVRSFPGADAKRVIVRARKGLRSGTMRLLAGIALYDAKGGEPSALMRGLAREGKGLNWG